MTSVAIDPKDTSHIVIASEQLDATLPSGDCATGAPPAPLPSTLSECTEVHVHVTFDAGRTWTDTRILPPSTTGVAYGITPKTSFLHDGTLLLEAHGLISVDSPAGGERSSSEVFAAHSTDGGKSFGQSSVVAMGSGGTVYAAVVPGGAGPAVDWRQVEEPAFSQDADGTIVSVWAALECPTNCDESSLTAHPYWSTSKDDGTTWSTPTLLPGSSSRAWPEDITTTSAAGWLVQIWNEIDGHLEQNPGPWSAQIARSTDHGEHWTIGPEVPSGWNARLANDHGTDALLTTGPEAANGTGQATLVETTDGGASFLPALSLDAPFEPGAAVLGTASGPSVAVAIAQQEKGGGIQFEIVAVSQDRVLGRAVIERDIATPLPAFGYYLGIAQVSGRVAAAWPAGNDGSELHAVIGSFL